MGKTPHIGFEKTVFFRKEMNNSGPGGGRRGADPLGGASRSGEPGFFALSHALCRHSLGER
jgi:hypothetical protein